MDTSKIAQALAEIAQQLKEDISILPFKPLSHYLEAFGKEFGGRNYRIHYGSVFADLGSSRQDMVFVIPIAEKFYPGNDNILMKYTNTRLIFERIVNGSGYFQWSVQRTEFSKFWETIPTELHSTKSEIVSCGSLKDLKSELEKIDLPQNLIPIVSVAFGEWIRESVLKRKEILKKLKKHQDNFLSVEKILDLESV